MTQNIQTKGGKKVCQTQYNKKRGCNSWTYYSGLLVTHQDGEHSAHKCDGRGDGGQDSVLKRLNQPSGHGGPRKVCLAQQLQPHA